MGSSCRVAAVGRCSCWRARAGSRGESCSAQEELIERPGPPPVDDLETDDNKDGIPDGWYNARDAKWMTEGGARRGPHFVRFECTQPGRPARLSRAFGVDGRKTEAIVLGLWVRQSNIQAGEREGDEPELMIDFLGDELRHSPAGSSARGRTRCATAGRGSPSEFPSRPAPRTRSCRSG